MQHPVTGLVPADGSSTRSDAWVRDNVYCSIGVWALSLAYQKRSDTDEGRTKAYELGQVGVTKHANITYVSSPQNWFANMTSHWKTMSILGQYGCGLNLIRVIPSFRCFHKYQHWRVVQMVLLRCNIPPTCSVRCAQSDWAGAVISVLRLYGMSIHSCLNCSIGL